MLCESVPVTTKSIVTALHQFLAQKRQERTRGKLAGLETQIQELKALGASYREIAEYLYQEHGLTVTPSGLQKNLKSLEAKRSPNAAVEPSAPDPSPPAQPPAPLPPPPALSLPDGNASAPRETFEENRQGEGTKIQNKGESPTEDVVAAYRLASPEHQELMATYRQRKNQAQT